MSTPMRTLSVVTAINADVEDAVNDLSEVVGELNVRAEGEAHA